MVLAAVAALGVGGCGGDPAVPDPGAGAIEGVTETPSAPTPTGYDHYKSPDGVPLDPDDPGEEFVRQVVQRHKREIRETPGYVRHGIGRADGRTVIVVVAQRPVSTDHQLGELEGVPVRYKLGGPVSLS